MTQVQLERAVAGATGESLRTIQARGFSLLSASPSGLEPEELQLVVTCPFCGHPAPIASVGSGLPVLAACGHCDVEFDFDPAEVYAASSAELDKMTHAA